MRPKSLTLNLPLAFPLLFLIVALALPTLLLPSQATAKSRCFGKPATQINRPGTHHLKRKQAIVVNVRATVIAKGDNRICAGRGSHNIKITLGKGTRNLVKLGRGDDVIRIKGPARENRIDAGDGNNRIFVDSRARRHKIITGSGNDRVKVRSKANSYSVSTGAGDDIVELGPRAKANAQHVDTGSGNDLIEVRSGAKAIKRTILAGAGDDVVRVRAKGNTEARLSPDTPALPPGTTDNDFYAGGHSNDTVIDNAGTNYIAGNNGVDTIRSVGQARSTIYGGNGSDRIFSNGGDEIYGGRGNDRIMANEPNPIGGVVADGGAGDDWLYGTDRDDTLMGSTGVNKVLGFGGDDLIRIDDGVNNVDGGSGTDTVSFAAHTPPGYANRSGVLVDLRQGIARGAGSAKLSNVQNVIGSSFDDIIKTDPRHRSEIWGGLGDDEIWAQDRDVIHQPFKPDTQSCRPNPNRTQPCEEPPPPGPDEPVIGVSPDGVLTVLGGTAHDTIAVDAISGNRYLVTASKPFARAVEHCNVDGGRADCAIPGLRNVLVYGDGGNDRITIGDGIPRNVSTVLDGGDGNNFIQGGPTADYIYTGRGQSTLLGGGGDDAIKASEHSATTIDGGPGHDLLRVTHPCQGHTVSGGDGKDNIVFAGSAHGVEVDFTSLSARWLNAPGSCTPTRLGTDIEGAEGTRHNDRFVGTRRRGMGFLGREGADTFITRNGRRDKITTGPGGRANKITADRFDRITWGWGFAAY